MGFYDARKVLYSPELDDTNHALSSDEEDSKNYTITKAGKIKKTKTAEKESIENLNVKIDAAAGEEDIKENEKFRDDQEYTGFKGFFMKFFEEPSKNPKFLK